MLSRKRDQIKRRLKLWRETNIAYRFMFFNTWKNLESQNIEEQSCAEKKETKGEYLFASVTHFNSKIVPRAFVEIYCTMSEFLVPRLNLLIFLLRILMLEQFECPCNDLSRLTSGVLRWCGSCVFASSVNSQSMLQNSGTFTLDGTLKIQIETAKFFPFLDWSLKESRF